MADNTWVTGYEVSVFIHLVRSLSTYLQLGYLRCCWWIGCRTWRWVDCWTQIPAIFIRPVRWHGPVHAVKKWLRRRAKASSRQMLANKSSSCLSIQREPNLTATPFPSGSDSQPSMVAFNSFLPGDRAIDVVNAPQLSIFAPGTIGGTNSFNDAGTSNVFGGATIGAKKQAEAILSTQMSRPLFDFGTTGGQLIGMDTTTHEDSVPVLGMGAGPSAVDTMQTTSSSLFNVLGWAHQGLQTYLRRRISLCPIAQRQTICWARTLPILIPVPHQPPLF